MLKQKIAYVGLRVHLKTKSTQFFINILKQYFEVDFFWDFGDTPEDETNKNAFRDAYEAVLCFQIMPNPKKLRESVCQNIILIPMYDHVRSYTTEQWYPYLNYKILSFSKTLHVKLMGLGVESLNVQFFPSPLQKSPRKEGGLRFFFWQRSAELNFSLIKQLIPPSTVERFQFHRMQSDSAQDVWFNSPTQEDIEAYHITFSSWFDTKEEMIQALDACDIYITPRMYEGIGMGFLEAMAMGKCVIAPNLPTMNEYIINGENGLLFDPQNPSELDLSLCFIQGENALKTIKKGYNRWHLDEEKIIEFLREPCKKIAKKEVLHVHNANMVFSRNLNFIHSYLQAKSFAKSSVVLYGAGTGAALLTTLLKNEIAYIVDIDASKHGNDFNGYVIHSPQKLLHDETTIIITVFGREEKIFAYLQKELLIDSERIIMLDLFN